MRAAPKGASCCTTRSRAARRRRCAGWPLPSSREPTAWPYLALVEPRIRADIWPRYPPTWPDAACGAPMADTLASESGPQSGDGIAWRPSDEYLQRSRLRTFMQRHGIDSFDELNARSTEDLD